MWESQNFAFVSKMVLPLLCLTEHPRIAPMVPGTFALPIGLLMSGWAAQGHAHWIVTDIVSSFQSTLRAIHFNFSYQLFQGAALVSAGIILTFQSIQTFIIDAFTLHAASGTSDLNFYKTRIFMTHTPLIALAAAACLRSLAGFGFPLFAPAMYNKLGYGKGNTILAVVSIVIGCPA